MPDDRARRPYRQILQIICIVLLLALLVSILISERLRMAADLVLVRAESVTVTERISAVGYVFRQETVLKSDENGALRYACRSGGTVATGDLLLTAYDGGTGTETRVISTMLTAELDFWYGLAEAEQPWQEAYFDSYEALMGICTANGAENRLEAAGMLLAALERREADRDAILLRIEALEQEFDTLVESANGAATPMHSPADGVFYREIDGYEGVFTPSALEGLTPTGLERLLATPAADAASVGKVVAGEATLAVVVSAETAGGYTAGGRYPVWMAGEPETTTLLLQAVSEADDSGVLLLFSLPAELATAERRVELSLPGETHTGLRVPMAAVMTEGEQLYVYVAVEGKATRRSVAPLLYRDGYCLAEESGTPEALHLDDEIVLTSRRIYEGRSLK